MGKEYFVYRPETGMEGPLPLVWHEIARLKDNAYGVYLLIYETGDGLPMVVYVGRGVLPERLSAHLDARDAHAFCCKLLDDKDEGFSEECRLFHHYGGREHLDNRRHPAVSSSARWNAASCSEAGCEGD